MKQLQTIFASILVVTLTASCALAGNKKEGHLIKPISPQFEKLASISGVWIGKKPSHDGSGEMVDIRVEYSTSSGGSALVEKLFSESHEEMISIYHDDGDSILMTHYCGFGNQPRMRSAKETKENQMRFEYVDATNMVSEKDPHMHQLTISFLNPNKIKHEWVMYKDGKEAGAVAFELNRVE